MGWCYFLLFLRLSGLLGQIRGSRTDFRGQERREKLVVGLTCLSIFPVFFDTYLDMFSRHVFEEVSGQVLSGFGEVLGQF